MEVFAVLASVQSMGLTGIQGYPVTVEAYCVDGMPMFEIVGLPDAAVKESREPVSYTHLDVYKRQIMISPMAGHFSRIMSRT